MNPIQRPRRPLSCRWLRRHLVAHLEVRHDEDCQTSRPGLRHRAPSEYTGTCFSGRWRHSRCSPVIAVGPVSTPFSLSQPRRPGTAGRHDRTREDASKRGPVGRLRRTHPGRDKIAPGDAPRPREPRRRRPAEVTLIAGLGSAWASADCDEGSVSPRVLPLERALGCGWALPSGAGSCSG